jgi:hypothetical protein
MLNKDKNPEVCDATESEFYSEAGYIIPYIHSIIFAAYE